MGACGAEKRERKKNMILTQEPVIQVQARAYRLEMLADRPAAKLYDSQNHLMAELFLLFSCHRAGRQDVSSRLSPWEIRETEDGYALSAAADSWAWEEKRITLRLLEDRLIYTPSLRGEGDLADAELLCGYYTGSNKRHSNARFYSGFHGESLFNPEPDGREEYFHPVEERALIDMTGVPIPGRHGWFFTPPPFCFVLRSGETCMTLGVAAKPGMHTFSEVEYLGGAGQGLLLRYDGCTHVSGRYELPQVHMIFGAEEYALLEEFCRVERTPKGNREQADWWKKPIFCGWGAQSALSQDEKLPAPALSNQRFYEQFTLSLDEKGIDPGIIVIDDKWQKHYGLNDVDREKWPDMEAFIARMHQKGRKVLLWLKAWDPEGVENRLCVRDFAGNPQAIDPENPEYLALFRQACEAMLSPRGLDADGFKIDFTARIPSCPGCEKYGQHWGLELMRDYLSMVHGSAKAIKKDALIMCHCPHPYLADQLDMIRLNDVNIGRPVCPQMLHRAKVARAALPDKLIDTDNWPMPDKSSWLEYVKLQPDLGVPSLYYLWHMDNSPEDITDQDLDTVRLSWRRWNEKNMK